MFRILYSVIVAHVLEQLVPVLAGHVTLDEWADIVKILKSRRPRPPGLAYCPFICRPAAWLSFRLGPGHAPRPRRFEQVMLFFRTWQPGPFNAGALALHLHSHWPGEALKILAPLVASGFLYRKKSGIRVEFWLARSQAPSGSPPGRPIGGGGLSDVGQSIEPALETQQKL